jgi:hypothetical protein
MGNNLGPSVPVHAHSTNRKSENQVRAVEKRGIVGDRTTLAEAKVRTVKPRPHADELYLMREGLPPEPR